jgi:hypothetical protein
MRAVHIPPIITRSRREVVIEHAPAKTPPDHPDELMRSIEYLQNRCARTFALSATLCGATDAYTTPMLERKGAEPYEAEGLSLGLLGLALAVR